MSDAAFTRQIQACYKNESKNISRDEKNKQRDRRREKKATKTVDCFNLTNAIYNCK